MMIRVIVLGPGFRKSLILSLLHGPQKAGSQVFPDGCTFISVAVPCKMRLKYVFLSEKKNKDNSPVCAIFTVIIQTLIN